MLNKVYYIVSEAWPMLKSSYKAAVGVIISIPPLVGGVADVVAEIKGTGWSISITFRFSVRLQTPDDLSRSRLVKDKQENDKIGSKPEKNGKRVEAEKSLKQLQWIPACCDDDDDYDSAITPILSTEEPIDSLSMGDEHLGTIPITESDEVIKSSVEDLVPIPSEFEGIPDTMCDVHFVNNPTPLEVKDHVEIVINSNDDISSSDDDSLHEENIKYVEASPHDSELVRLEAAEIVIPEVEEIEDHNLREKLLNVHLLIANIEALKDNPTQSSELLTKSSSTSLNSFLEETNTFHNSLPEFKNFCFDLEEISSGSTTTHSDISLSKYDSFIFDFAHKEFVDELAYIISPLKYDCFYFWNLPDPGELMSVLNSGICENLPSATNVNLPIEDDHSPLLAYVVWIFVAYLTLQGIYAKGLLLLVEDLLLLIQVTTVDTAADSRLRQLEQRIDMHYHSMLIVSQLGFPWSIKGSLSQSLSLRDKDLQKSKDPQVVLEPFGRTLRFLLNVDSPIPTRVIDGVVQPVAPTTAEQRLARKNILMARGTLLMALPDKHQLKFNIHKDSKTLMKAIEKRPVTSVSAAGEKVPVYALLNLDTLSDAAIYSFFASQSNSLQLDNDDLKQIDADDLKEIDLKWQMAMLTMRARRFLQRTRRNIGANGTTSIEFNMSKVECYNCHKRGHFARECMLPKDTKRNVLVKTQRRNVPVETSMSNALVSQCDGVGSYDWSFQAEKNRPTMPSWHLPPLVLPVLIMRDNALVDLKKNLRKQNKRDDLKIKIDKFQTSFKNLRQLLASQTNDKTRLGYANQVFTSSMFDCDEMFSSKSDVSMPASLVYDRYQSREGYHAVPPPYTRIFMPPKPDLVFHDAPTIHETVPTAFNVELSPTKPDKELSPSNRPSSLLIKDRVFDSDDKSKVEPKHTQTKPSFVQPTEHVKTSRPSVKTGEHPILASNLSKDIPKSRGHNNSRNKKAWFVCKSFTYLIKDCDYYEKKMVQKPVRNHAMRGNSQQYVKMTTPNPQRHTTVIRPRPAKTIVTKPHSPQRRNINHRPSLKPSNFPQKVTTAKVLQETCHISDFEETNGRYVAFGENLKYGKIIGKCKIRTCKLDFDDVYFVKELKFNLFRVLQMCDKKNIVLFTDTECIVLSSDFKFPDDNHETCPISDFEETNGRYVAFGENPKDDTECIVLSSDFKFPDDNHVLLRVPRENNMYNVDLKNILPSGDLTCLFAKTTLDESNLWHRRLGDINFKTMNKLVKGNLVRGLPSKVFQNNHTCVACKKGKQHRASCMSKPVSSVSQPLQRVLVTKHHNKTPYELLLGRTPSIDFMRPFGCPMTILNTLDPLGKFDRKVDEGFLVGYSEINLTLVQVSKNILMQIKKQREMFNSMCFFPLWSFGSKDPQNTDDDATFEAKEPEFEVEKLESEVHVSPTSSAKTKKHDDKTKREAKGKSPVELSTRFRNLSEEFKDFFNNSINEVNAASTSVLAVGQISTNNTNTFSAPGPSNTVVCPILRKSSYVDPSQYPDDPNMPALEDITYFDDEEDVGAEADFSNLDTTITVSSIPTTRVHKDHPVTQIIGDLSLATQIRSMTRMVKDQGGLTQIHNEDFHTCMFACFLSQEEPKRVHQDLKDPNWIEAIQEEILQFKMQKVWVLVDLPKGFENPDYPDKVYKVVKALYGLHQAPKAWYETLANYLLENDLCKVFEKLMKDKFQMSLMGEITFFLGLQVKQKPAEIFISYDKYVAKILRKFGLSDGKSASTPIDTEKPLLNDPDGEDMDIHTYRSMIGSLMYLTSSRPDIMFVVCAFATSSTEAEYVAAASCCAQVLWIQNQLLDYGYNFMHTTIYIDNSSTQTVVATSSTEAEYVAAASCCAQVLWIQNQLLDYGITE
nr:hypothetical protein [Tanacetum cinerariifolium]